MKSRYRLPVGLVLAHLVILSTSCGPGQMLALTLTPAPTNTSPPISTPTLTPTSTSISTPELTLTPAFTATPIPVLISTLDADVHTLSEVGVIHNADWTPYTEEINGVLMALVPAGCFQMGSDDGTEMDHPVHQVCFEEPFWIDVTEVTNSQFTQFGGQAATLGAWADADRPREQISWIEADALCQKRDARLPTEAEWEYSARGPDGLEYPWGNEFIATIGVFGGYSNGQTWDVGSKPGDRSWVGAVDLGGNVEEWVNDWFEKYPSGRQVNPMGPESGEGRVLRGGAWFNTDPYSTRAAFRYWGNPAVGHSSAQGFRCARSD